MLASFQRLTTYLLVILIYCCSTQVGGYSRARRQILLDAVHFGLDDLKDQRSPVDVSQAVGRHQRSPGEGGTRAPTSKTYVLRGRLGVLNFIAGRKERTLLDPVIEWTRSSGEPLNDGRYKTTESGSLTITDTEAKDSGEYTCVVRGTYDKGKQVKRRFSHELVVFILPELNYLVNLKYKTAACDDALKNYKMTQIKSKLCNDQGCNARDVSARCHSLSEGSDIRQELWVSFTVIPADDIDIPDCSITCMTAAIMRALNTRLRSVKQFVQKEANKDDSDLTITTNDMTIKLESPCPSGNKKNDAICIACTPGSYSQDMENTCTLCAKGTYQEQYAMRDCSKCEGILRTEEEGSASKDQCVKLGALSEGTKVGLAAGVGGAVGLVVLVIAAMIFKMYLNSKKTDVVKKKPLESGHGGDQAGKPLLNPLKTGSDTSLYLPQRKSRQKKNKSKNLSKKDSKSKRYKNPGDEKVANYVASLADQQVNGGIDDIPSDHTYMCPIPSWPSRSPLPPGIATYTNDAGTFDDNIYETLNPDPHYIDWSSQNYRPPAPPTQRLEVSHSYKSPEELYKERLLPPIPPPRRSTQSVNPQRPYRR